MMNMKVNIPAAPALAKPSDFGPLVKPSNFKPAAAPAAPQGVATRSSASADMAPRQSLASQFGLPPQPAPQGPGGPGRPGPDLAAINQQGGNDATSSAKGSVEQSMKAMAEMNAISMQSQMQVAVMNMEKGFTEALAKTVKDIGAKVAQLAS
jgi:hypothetical protein